MRNTKIYNHKYFLFPFYYIDSEKYRTVTSNDEKDWRRIRRGHVNAPIILAELQNIEFQPDNFELNN